jgi:DNA integrity scanning protein DisA with diadenylate cyclase activity
MASVIDKELIQYFIKLDDSQKKSLLEMIKSFLKSSDDNFERVTLEQYNSELDKAMDRINIGEFTTFEDLEKEMQLW